MVYKRKTNRQTWCEINMTKAIEAVRKKEMGLKRASKQYKVPRTTLQRRCRLRGGANKAAKKGMVGLKRVVNEAMENEIVQHVKFMEGMLFRFTRTQIRQLAFEYAEVNGIQNTFNGEKEAGLHWLNDFMARHKDELSLRTPDATSAARARGFNAVSVGRFFTLLEQLQALHSFTPDRIYNVDETGVSTVPNRLSRIIATRGKKQVRVLSSYQPINCLVSRPQCGATVISTRMHFLCIGCGLRNASRE